MLAESSPVLVLPELPTLVLPVLVRRAPRPDVPAAQSASLHRPNG
jgi:hypothetical protein